MMEQEKISIRSKNSTLTPLGGLVITARNTDDARARIIVGRPGLPNLERLLLIGDAVLYETPDQGLFEIRLLRCDTIEAELLLTRVAPRPGLTGGLYDTDPQNTPFTPQECEQIAVSFKQVFQKLQSRPEFNHEQLDLIERKLDEIKLAADRLGRKDWINLTIGTLTSVVVNAALPPETARILFNATSDALSWLIHGALQLLK